MSATTAAAPAFRRARTLSVAAALLALVALLAMGALAVRQRYLTRGIPAGLPEPVAGGGPALGLNVYLEGYSDAELAHALQEVKALGVTAVKQPFHYTTDFDWEGADRIINAVSNAGLALVPLLDGDPASAFAPPADPADFAAWAAEFATRYGDQLDAFVIWDEPNLASHWGGVAANPAEYAAVLTAASAAIRAADPDAFIVAAPLAPTTETGPQNLSEPLFLNALYEAGAADAFDAVASKPYGFDSGPLDRTVSADALNFSRAILLREALEGQGEPGKAVWAGNWGWNSLPHGWTGAPSIWGQTGDEQRAEWTVAALERARTEWPWMGLMFLENWEPDAPADDPRWGFSIAGTKTAEALATYLAGLDPTLAQPGFHLARPDDPAQTYEGGWRFSPNYGADISQTGDRVTLRFWGTEVGLRVRRADFRARLYATIDGGPANALPRDEFGTALVLTSGDPADDAVVTEPIARDLVPGPHTLELVASRGWDQWALNGFSIGNRPPSAAFRWSLLALGLAAVGLTGVAIHQARRARWSDVWRNGGARFSGLSDMAQIAVTAIAAFVAALAGWLTWNGQAEALYRRLGETGQLAATAAAATVFYVSPAFVVYAGALAVLFVLLTFRPAWGLALIALVIPFYVPPLPKPILNYRFSPIEVFTLVTAFAWATRSIFHWARERTGDVATRISTLRWTTADSAVTAFVLVATVSLFFTERLGVATNEWRVVIIEPALFYLLLRAVRPGRREMAVILGAFVLGGLLVALYGLWQYASGTDLITAEGGLMRLRSIYGSPNNVGLYLGRIIPLVAAVALFTWASVSHRTRLGYLAVLAILALAVLLSFSKGALILGLPAGLAVVFWLWQRYRGRRAWPWLLALAVAGVAALVVASRVPALAARLDLFGATGVFRLNLWRSAVHMIQDHPLFGVGLDNFLYAYRGRYILDAAWQEPNLNHPHNVLLDFATRLGLVGLAVGIWLFFEAARFLRRSWLRQSALLPGSLAWLAVVAGLAGTLADALAHGLVDHSFFLVDLAFAFCLLLGTAVWLSDSPEAGGPTQNQLEAIAAGG